MSSFIYDSFVDNLLVGNYDFGSFAYSDSSNPGTGTFTAGNQQFYLALVDNAYKISSASPAAIAGTDATSATTAAGIAKKTHKTFADIVSAGGDIDTATASGDGGENSGTSGSDFVYVDGGKQVLDGSGNNGVTLAQVLTGSGNNATQETTTINFSTVTWASATIKARGAILYAHNLATGSAASNNSEKYLIAFLDFSGLIQSYSGNFAVTIDSGLKFLNPKTV